MVGDYVDLSYRITAYFDEWLGFSIIMRARLSIVVLGHLWKTVRDRAWAVEYSTRQSYQYLSKQLKINISNDMQYFIGSYSHAHATESTLMLLS